MYWSEVYVGATVTAGMIFHCDPDDINQIKEYIEQVYNADIVCIKQSWGRLWLKEGDAP
jgi:hypothetical protein